MILTIFLLAAGIFAGGPGTIPGLQDEEPPAASEPAPVLAFESPDQSLETTQDKAAAAGRMVMLEIHTAGCEGSKRLAVETYTDSRVAALLVERFVCARIDADSEEGAFAARIYKAASSPIVIFTDAEGEVIDWVIGFLPADDFMKRVQSVCDGKNTFRNFKVRYEADPTDLQAGLGYAAKLTQRQDQKETEKAYEVLEAILEVARKDKRPEAGVCLVLLYPKALADGKIEETTALLEELIADYSATAGTESAYLLLSQIYEEVEEDLPKAVDLLRKGAKQYEGQVAASALRYRLATYLEENEDLEGALAELNLITGKDADLIANPSKTAILVKLDRKEEAIALCREWRAACGDDPVRVNAVAWTCHENGILLAEALEWARLNTEKDGGKTSAYVDTYAWLLYDNGQPEKAAKLEERILFESEDDEEIENYGTALKVFREAAEKARAETEGG